MFHVCLRYAVLSVPYSLVITCWERSHLLALLCVVRSVVDCCSYCGVLCLLHVCCALLLLCVFSSFEMILMGKRKLFDLLCLSSWCLVAFIVLWLFLAVGWSAVCECGILLITLTCYFVFSCVFVAFPYGDPGQVWYLIVSIPDRFVPLYFASVVMWYGCILHFTLCLWSQLFYLSSLYVYHLCF